MVYEDNLHNQTVNPSTIETRNIQEGETEEGSNITASKILLDVKSAHANINDYRLFAY